MSIFDDYKIIKELGHGMIGTVYLIETNIKKKNKSNNNKNEYALKIEHIEKKDLKPNTKSDIWRELNFYKNIGNKYPNQFVSLIEYDFINNCEHSQKYSYDINLFPKKIQNKLKKRASSPYCIRKIFDLVDGNLSELIEQLEQKQIYSMLIQIAYSIKILHKYNYVHGDLHSGNIGWNKTINKNIQIDGLKVKTFGYIFKLIDFGLVLSDYDVSSKQEKVLYNKLIKTEFNNLKYILVDTKFWDWFEKNNLKWDFEKTYLEIKKTAEFEIIKKFTTEKNDQVFLFDILFQEKFQKIVCGNSYRKTIPRKLFVPIEDLLVLIKISSESDLLIKYFYDKINQ